jgi:hypothetical protein
MSNVLCSYIVDLMVDKGEVCALSDDLMNETVESSPKPATDALSIVMRNHFEATRSQGVELITRKEISRFTVITTSCQFTINLYHCI